MLCCKSNLLIHSQSFDILRLILARRDTRGCHLFYWLTEIAILAEART